MKTFFSFLRREKLLLICVLVYILVRLVFICTSPYAFNEEENRSSALSVDLVKGHLRLPFFCYMDTPHGGGRVFVSLFTLPFYLIFGNTYLSLKLTALTLSLMSFILIVKLLYKIYGVNILIPLGLLFSLSTPHYIQKSVLLVGNCSAFIFFLTIVIYIFYRIFIEGRRNLLNFVLLGFFSGFGFWVQYGQSSIIVTLILFWYLSDKLFFLRKEFFVFLIFLIVGLLPWICYNLIYDFASFTVDSVASFGARSISILLSNLPDFFGESLPRSFHFLDFYMVGAKVFAYVLYGIFIFLTVYLMWCNRKNILKILFSLLPHPRFNLRGVNLEVFLLVYFFITVVMLRMSVFPICGNGEWGLMRNVNEHYIVFLQPIIFILSSISLSKLMDVRHNAKLGKMLSHSAIFAIGIILIIGFSRIVSFKNFNRFLTETVYGPMDYEIGFIYVRNFKIFKRIAQEIDIEARMDYFRGAGMAWNNICNGEGGVTRQKVLLGKYLKLMNSKEKKIFFYYLLKGEDVKTEGRVPLAKLYEEVNSILTADEERMLLNDAFNSLISPDNSM